jgi:hypothetical protein
MLDETQRNLVALACPQASTHSRNFERFSSAETGTVSGTASPLDLEP